MWKQICSRIGQVVLNAVTAMALVFLVAAGIGNPARADDADFSGSWDSSTDKGWTYALELKQKGRKVSGTYVAMNGDKGTMKGVVDDDQLELTWKQGEFRGTAQFTMSSDNNSFSGVYTAEDNPELESRFFARHLVRYAQEDKRVEQGFRRYLVHHDRQGMEIQGRYPPGEKNRRRLV